ncbi:hypothetical protein [Halomonas koreensis]|uniref:Uncharacterized protein n=1 Tax=Halomonas koreensis TaxID=245385 RepID=A0ABU1FYD8_9GAMM|nr:hypothetical protein [Halomonas koreensis]MDR5865368.1 hypothetical protein [Halomonas koreensis]
MKQIMQQSGRLAGVIPLSLIQGIAMQDISRLEVGMTTKIGTDQVKNPEVGREYVRGFDSNSWLLFAEDPAEDRPVVVRIDSIDGDVCHCTVTRKLS